jgi:hypothetical protein
MRTAVLADGRIVMEPLPDGGYRGRSHVLPMNLAGTAKAKGPDFSGPFVPLVGVGCGGTQWPSATRQLPLEYQPSKRRDFMVLPAFDARLGPRPSRRSAAA